MEANIGAAFLPQKLCFGESTGAVNKEPEHGGYSRVGQMLEFPVVRRWGKSGNGAYIGMGVPKSFLQEGSITHKKLGTPALTNLTR